MTVTNVEVVGKEFCVKLHCKECRENYTWWVKKVALAEEIECPNCKGGVQ